MTPRRVVITWADTQGLTVLEQARACVLAGVKPAHAGRLMRRYATGEAEPEELLAGALLFYAVGYELELRHDPGASWEAWQTVDLKLDMTERGAEQAAIAEHRVRTALATGLTPAEAERLTMADVQAYNVVRAEQADELAGTRRGRRRRSRIRR